MSGRWSAAGREADFPAGEITPVALPEGPVVLYRRSGGALVALADRCPHRSAPLSAGCLLGEEVLCPFHGYRFGPDGRCTHVPGEPRIPSSLAVQAFPVAVQDGVVFVWTGEPQAADPALIGPSLD